MNRYFMVFIVFALVMVWTNEWCKININYQLMMRDRFQEFDHLTLEKKLEIKKFQVDIAPYAMIYSHSDWNWFYNQDRSFWTISKWVIPIVFTLSFALLEWRMLPFCFQSVEVKRNWIVLYYLALIVLVLLMYALSKATDNLIFQNIGRKVWMILQSPSFFVLVLIDQWRRKYEN